MKVGTPVGERVGLGVGERVGDVVAGIVSSHVMETPAATVPEPDVKRMNMLPDVAVWIAGVVMPLNLPLSKPDDDVPS